jgi:iduronate 2-sulfatase
MATRRYKGPAWEAPPARDADLTDGRTAQKAVSVLRELKSLDQPFFLAVGFVKPHAPFVAPARYFDRVNRPGIQLPAQRTLPNGAPALAATSDEMRGYHGVPQAGVFPDDTTLELTIAYDACVSYVDAQVGIVLDELQRLGLRENTVVLFLSDHGYHLGEVGQWCKNTNFEESLRVPLIISDPRAKKAAGRTTEAIVELIDLYPTLASLCGLPAPPDLEGSCFRDLVNSPQQRGKIAAFSQHQSKLPGEAAAVGYSVRTAEFRYTRWQTPRGQTVAEELYEMDDARTANRNLVREANYALTANKLRELLDRGLRGAAPPDAKDRPD